MDISIALIIGLIASYLIGSISSAIITCNIMKLPDPRTHGSRNPGATNVLRVAGKKAAAYTLLGDALKGFIPVLIGFFFLNAHLLGYIGLAAILGHMYPIFFRFQGGKGVATYLGMLFGIYWLIALMWLVTWIIVLKLTRYSSLAALLSTALSIVYFILLGMSYLLIPVCIIVVLIFWRHRGNIQRLIAGTESKS